VLENEIKVLEDEKIDPSIV